MTQVKSEETRTSSDLTFLKSTYGTSAVVEPLMHGYGEEPARTEVAHKYGREPARVEVAEPRRKYQRS